MMKKISANKKIASWLHKKWFRRWIDFPTLLIGCCWLGMLLLWPDISLRDRDHDASFKSMVVAHDVEFSEEDMYRRPDLIAMPSSMSFIPDVEDERDMMVSFKKELNSCMLERSVSREGLGSTADVVALAAEAIRDVGKGVGWRSAVESRLSATRQEAGNGVLVWVSESIGREVALNWTETDYAGLFGGSSGWEVELSLVIGQDCSPESIFLEKPSGDDMVDRKIVQVLSRADLWQEVVPGVGSVMISFSPKVE